MRSSWERAIRQTPPEIRRVVPDKTQGLPIMKVIFNPVRWRAGMVVSSDGCGCWTTPVAMRLEVSGCDSSGDQLSFPDAVLAKQEVVGDEISAVSR
nr:hypothetical protein Iba_chr01aCG2590 [Ipomoea batatas]